MGSLLGRLIQESDDHCVKEKTLLSREDKESITNTWAIIRDDAKNNGIDLFIMLFQKYPRMQTSFPGFKDAPLTLLREDKKFQAHCTSFIHTINNVIDNIDDSYIADYILQGVGRKHRCLDYTIVHFRRMEKVMLLFLEDKLKSKFTPDVAHAWETVLNYIFTTVQIGNGNATRYSLDLSSNNM